MTSSAALIQAAHADLVKRLAAAEAGAPEGERGAYVSKLIGGRRYWYVQTPTSEGRRQKYVGQETPELIERIAQHRAARADAKERQVLATLLVRTFRASRPPAESGEVVAALAQAGLFRQNAILLGSLLRPVYAAILGTGLIGAAPRPEDPIQIACPTVPSLLTALQGTAKAFRVMSRGEGAVRVTSYISDRLRVDALTPIERPDDPEPRLLDYLLEKPEQAVLLHDAGILVAVPDPARYALASILGPVRTEEDVAEAQALIRILLQDRPAAFGQAWRDADGRGKAWRQRLFEALPLLPLNARSALSG